MFITLLPTLSVCISLFAGHDNWPAMTFLLISHALTNLADATKLCLPARLSTYDWLCLGAVNIQTQMQQIEAVHHELNSLRQDYK